MKKIIVQNVYINSIGQCKFPNVIVQMDIFQKSKQIPVKNVKKYAKHVIIYKNA